MSRVNQRWMALATGLAGFAVGELVWAPAGIGLTFVALFFGFGAIRVLNTIGTRLVFIAIGILHGAVIARASGSWLLGVAPAVGVWLLAPSELVNRRLGYQSTWMVPVALLAELAIAAAAWPPTSWHLALLPSLLGLALLSVMFVSGLRQMGERVRATKAAVGDVVADFTLPARLGRGDVTLSSFRGRHVLLCLLRGDWCPVCQVMMRILAKDAKRLAERGVQVIAVSTSGGSDADELAKLLGVDYLFVIDEQCVIATGLGAVDRDMPEPGKSSSLPAMVLVDPDGKLAWLSTAVDVTVHDPTQALRFLDAPAPQARAA